MKKIILRGMSLVLLLTFFYFLFACGKKKEETKCVSATRGDIREKALAVGTIEPEKETKVKSIIPGIVAEVLFKVGDAVKSGQPLFKISPNPTPLEYVESRRSMELAEVTMRKLKSDWTRQLELFKDRRKVENDTNMSDAEKAPKLAELDMKLAELAKKSK